MHILHLAFEDHLRPGSGGGSLRNQQINSRLASEGHRVDVVTANYPGASPRLEAGVSYRQCGFRHGNAVSLLSHQVSLPRLVATATRTSRPDVIVEEFAPLTSSLGVGHWTDLPTIGIAQGFFAEEKAREYHLPSRLLTGIQRWGVRSHDHLIAVSEDVGSQLRAVAPSVPVTVIANGVDMAAADAARWTVQHRPQADVVPYVLFLGRLEIAQKGLDILIAAMDEIANGTRVILAGAGKDRAQITRDIAERGLSGRVELIGAVHGEDKWRLIAGASLLVQPSRYETFGISPLEAMACGTPVVASDLACLRELIPATTGVLVPREDPGQLASAINRLLASTSLRRQMGDHGPEVARRYGWEAIARAQSEVYASVIERSRSWVNV